MLTSKVLGFFETKREPFMAIVYFFSDESGKQKKNRSVTVAGVGISKIRLEAFEEEWDVLLRSYELQEFHMSRVSKIHETHGLKLLAGQTLVQRQELLFPFADCIAKYFEIGLMQATDVEGFIRLPMEARQLIGGPLDAHFLTFSRGLLEVVKYIRPEDQLSVICDDNLQLAWDTYLHYRALSASSDDVQKKIAGITFAKSRHFLALQAADMVAFLTRKEAIAKFYGDCNEFEPLFARLVDGRPSGSIIRWFNQFADEKTMLNLANSLLALKETNEQK
jgi:hypothetical protein